MHKNATFFYISFAKFIVSKSFMQFVQIGNCFFVIINTYNIIIKVLRLRGSFYRKREELKWQKL